MKKDKAAKNFISNSANKKCVSSFNMTINNIPGKG